MAIRFVAHACAWLMFAPTLLAASGLVSGRVTSRGDGEPLVGVNVLLQGTVRGTSTNINGEYRITAVPPGTYTLVFSLVGFQRETRSGIVVEDGKTTSVDVAMSQVPVQTDQVVVTANRREQSLAEVPISISILDASEVRYRNSQTIEDAVRYVPGVNLTGGQVNIRGSSGYSRGAGSRIIMLLDGIPFIAGDTGELVFETIPAGQVDRIEVVKGASSALYGSSALGGVINVITKPISESHETYLRTYGGMYNQPSYTDWKWSERNRYFGGFSVGHSFTMDDVGVALFFNRQVDDGFRQNDHRRRYNIYSKVKKEFSSDNSLTLNFGLLSQGGGQFQYWANAVDSALRPPAVQREDRVASSRYYLSGAYNDALTDNFLFSAKALWNHNNWKSSTIHDVAIPGSVLLPSGRYDETLESLANGYRLDLSSTWLVSDDHTGTFGLGGQYDVVTSASKLFGKHTGWGAAFFAQDEWKATRQLQLTLGARVDVQSVGLAESGAQINPKAALSYIPASGTSVRASFGRGYRVPAVAEVFVSFDLGGGLLTSPNTRLRPERSYSYEIGFSQQFGTLASVDYALFRTDYIDLIEPTPYDSAGRPRIQWQNTAEARVEGMELSLKLNFFDGDLRYLLGYTYVDSEDLTLHIPLPYRPNHLFYSNLIGELGIFRLGVDFRFISRVERIYDLFANPNFGLIKDAGERVEIWVTDFRIGADLTSLGIPINASVSVNNAFRYNYLELTANMSPPRTFVLVLESKL